MRKEAGPNRILFLYIIVLLRIYTRPHPFFSKNYLHETYETQLFCSYIIYIYIYIFIYSRIILVFFYIIVKADGIYYWKNQFCCIMKYGSGLIPFSRISVDAIVHIYQCFTGNIIYQSVITWYRQINPIVPIG